MWGLFRSTTMTELLGHVHRGGEWSGNGFWVPHTFALASLEPGASWNCQCSLVSRCGLGSSSSPSEMALERHWQQAQRSPLSNATQFFLLARHLSFLQKIPLRCLGAASISPTEQQSMPTYVNFFPTNNSHGVQEDAECSYYLSLTQRMRESNDLYRL